MAATLEMRTRRLVAQYNNHTSNEKKKNNKSNCFNSDVDESENEINDKKTARKETAARTTEEQDPEAEHIPR